MVRPVSQKVNKFNKKTIKQKADKNSWLQRSLVLIMLLSFLLFLILPLSMLFSQAFFDNNQKFIGVANFSEYFTTPALVESLKNSLTVSSLTTIISVSLAFFFSYGLTRTNMFGKTIFRYILLLPLFAPTMFYGIGLMYLFGNQGIVTNGLFGVLPPIKIELYGPVGIVLAEILYTLPQAFMILLVAFKSSDYRLYEASEVLYASKLKQFFTVTLPSVKYGLISAMFISFTLCFTDYGAPKIVGGMYNVLATDVYKKVIGQQNFAMGATVGILLMLPALMAFVVDQVTNRKAGLSLTAKSTAYQIKPNKGRDLIYTIYGLIVALAVLLVFFAVTIAAVVNVFPYDMGLTLKNFNFNTWSGDGLVAYKNSLIVASLTALIGVVVTFLFAYSIEKIRIWPLARKWASFFSVLPIALPGLVLGLSYVFFFSKPEIQVFSISLPNPLYGLYGTIGLLVIVNILHFYSVSFVTATTALKKLDGEFEMVAEAMSIPFYKLLFQVTLPLSFGALVEMAMYLFVNSMVTISAVIFLYPPDFKLAAVSIINMEDSGNVAAAAAMCLLIVCTNLLVRICYEAATKGISIIKKRRNERSE
ncbi:putative 2-aminoethylphosphonate ABC transporter permease subunit [Carnobacterium gallinarum]|uniref:putative 2-aminoethylphosphonate ABC transporter permease subunit n=1 Tax=Carnobacterium gallinarum TaxID=2749 RepID=UPI00068D034A|nr:putative 2-aminoethylphosphonate ABC transporter permease subunit [Carnobacterium gallinarum]